MNIVALTMDLDGVREFLVEDDIKKSLSLPPRREPAVVDGLHTHLRDVRVTDGGVSTGL